MANASFPYDVKKLDLEDPTLGRFNRAFRYIWDKLQPLLGDGSSGAFLNGAGVYTTPASGDFPPAHNSPGKAGQIAYDTIGNVYFAFGKNTWVRLGPSGTSTTF